MTYKFTVSNKTFTIVDHIDLDVKTNTRENTQDYVIVLSSGSPIITNDNVSPANVLGSGGHMWYEFKKEPMMEDIFLLCLAEKLGLEESIARQFNKYIGRDQNEQA